MTRIPIDCERIAEFCRRHHIHKPAVFDSVLRDDFCPDSDVDVLVWFDLAYMPGLFRLMAMQYELAEIIGREVDLRMPEELSCHFRQEVIDESEVQYAASDGQHALARYAGTMLATSPAMPPHNTSGCHHGTASIGH